MRHVSRVFCEWAFLSEIQAILYLKLTIFYACTRVDARQSVAAGRVIARFMLSLPLSVSSLDAALRVIRPSRARTPPCSVSLAASLCALLAARPDTR